MTEDTKISILCHDLSINSLGRAHLLATALQRYYQVQIIGHMRDRQIWEPLRDDLSVSYRILTTWNPYSIAKLIDGDLILASKTRGTSFGYGLLCKWITGKPLIVDIDDWDLAFFFDSSFPRKLHDLAQFWDLNSSSYSWLSEKLVHKADAITVSNEFLRTRFGGTLVPHFRDTDQFDPVRFDGLATKKQLGLEQHKLILFLGTPRKHKGITELIEAIESLQRTDVKLLIIGASAIDEAWLPSKPFLHLLGPQPFREIPQFLAAADIVTIFQSDSKSSQGQLPAKIFDAMSMGKAVIASRISDLPKVLEGCGMLVEPGDTRDLAATMNKLLDDPTRVAELGKELATDASRDIVLM